MPAVRCVKTAAGEQRYYANGKRVPAPARPHKRCASPRRSRSRSRSRSCGRGRSPPRKRAAAGKRKQRVARSRGAGRSKQRVARSRGAGRSKKRVARSRSGSRSGSAAADSDWRPSCAVSDVGRRSPRPRRGGAARQDSRDVVMYFVRNINDDLRKYMSGCHVKAKGVAEFVKNVGRLLPPATKKRLKEQPARLCKLLEHELRGSRCMRGKKVAQFLGAGSFGFAFRLRDKATGKTSAAKLMLDDDAFNSPAKEAAIQKAAARARIAPRVTCMQRIAVLGHRRATILEMDVQDATMDEVLKSLLGKRSSRRVKENALPKDELLALDELWRAMERLMREMAKAKITHGDMWTPNIMVRIEDRAAGTGHANLIDFGLSSSGRDFCKADALVDGVRFVDSLRYDFGRYYHFFANRMDEYLRGAGVLGRGDPHVSKFGLDPWHEYKDDRFGH